jgi:NarL family two-component system response regulator LiaR
MAQTKPIRVIIVDDHAMVRDGLRVFLETFKDIEVVGESEDGEKALSLCQQLEPDVILMDMVMPKMDGPTATRTIRKYFPQIQVIALTSFPEEGMVPQAIQAGAIGYLFKDIQPEQLAAAIRAACDNQPTLAPLATQALIHATTQPTKPGHDLTQRERDVLSLMVRGHTNAEIAGGLTLSPSTVNFHVSNILSKLGTINRTEAVSLAVKHHLVSGD